MPLPILLQAHLIQGLSVVVCLGNIVTREGNERLLRGRLKVVVLGCRDLHLDFNGASCLRVGRVLRLYCCVAAKSVIENKERTVAPLGGEEM